MKAYNAAVKRWAIMLTINGQLTSEQIWKIECWIWNTSGNTKELDEMLEDIYTMAKEMFLEIRDRFGIEKPINIKS